MFELWRTRPGSVLDSGKLGLIIVMIIAALAWGGPLVYIFIHTKFSLRAYFVLLTLIAALLAGFGYINSHR